MYRRLEVKGQYWPFHGAQSCVTCHCPLLRITPCQDAVAVGNAFLDGRALCSWFTNRSEICTYQEKGLSPCTLPGVAAWTLNISGTELKGRNQEGESCLIKAS